MAKTYDDIVRKTVPGPGGSWQPTKEQEQQALDGFRALDPQEQALQRRVQAALAGHGEVQVEVEGDRVILRGRVHDPKELTTLPDLVRAIDGVGSVDDQLVVS